MADLEPLEPPLDFPPPPDPPKRSNSISSVESFLPPPAPFKRGIVMLLLSISLLTVFQLCVGLTYSMVQGDATNWYTKPHSWPFCVVYADSTTQYWTKTLSEGLATKFATLSLMNCFYAWLALVATFRALYHYEWIPSTIVLLFYIILFQLCYYGSSDLVTVPNQLVTTTLAVARWVRLDMYKDLGYLCLNVEYNVEFGALAGWQSPYDFESKNCTDAVILLTPEMQRLGFLDKLEAIDSTAVPNKKLNCDGAVALHVLFLAVQFSFVFITLCAMVVLIIGDRNIRQRLPIRHYYFKLKEDLYGSRAPQILSGLATIGYVMQQAAKCNSAFLTISMVKGWPVVNTVMDGTLTLASGIPIALKVDMIFKVNTWWPFETNQLDIQTVLLVVNIVAVVRGVYKQSKSAFRLAAVAALLEVIVQCPPLFGNIQSFHSNNLWWWQDDDECANFFKGDVWFDPNHSQRVGLCRNTRFAIAGSLLQFASMNCQIVACWFVFWHNFDRDSIRYSQYDYEHPTGAEMALDVHNGPLDARLIPSGATRTDL